MEKKEKRELIKIIIIATILALLGISIIFTNPISRKIEHLSAKLFNTKINAGMIVHFIDVGQGDAIALQLPTSEIILIDCGPKDSQNAYIKYLKDNVFADRQDKVVDYLIFTHSDVDHTGGGCAVLGEFEVKNIYRPNIASINEEVSQFNAQATTDEYAELISSINSELNAEINIISDGMKFKVGDVNVEFYGPINKYQSTNQLSPFIKVSYLDNVLLFTGDAYGQAEYDILAKYSTDLNADIIKVSHHGAKNSLTQELLQAVTPEYAVITVGENSYGHPDASTLVLLDNLGVKTYRTDKDGSVKFVASKTGIDICEYNVISQQKIYWWAIAGVVFACLSVQLAVIIYKRINKDKLIIEEDSGL